MGHLSNRLRAGCEFSTVYTAASLLGFLSDPLYFPEAKLILQSASFRSFTSFYSYLFVLLFCCETFIFWNCLSFDIKQFERLFTATFMSFLLCLENRCPGDRRVLRADVWHFQKLWVRLHSLLPVQRLSWWQHANGTALALWKSGWGRRRGLGNGSPHFRPSQTSPESSRWAFALEQPANKAGAVDSRAMWVAQSSPYRHSGSLEVFSHRPSHRHTHTPSVSTESK